MTQQNADAPIPAFLHDQLEAAYQAEVVQRLLDGYRAAASRPVTLRANTLKADAETVAGALGRVGIGFTRVPWYEDAFVLDDAVSERDVWTLDIYREGAVYLQSLSSMTPPLALGPRAGADALDMCAAPGGKTSQMAAVEPEAHITACELSAPRAEKLTYNLQKLGAHNVQVMKTDARRLDEFFSFDQILLDAPCTGTGTVRAGDPRAEKRITAQLLAKVTRSQAQLLDRALTVLKPGGELVYSTCSVLPQENEEQVRSALKAKRHRDCELVPLNLDAAWTEGDFALPLLENGLPGTLTIAPARHFEGFYIAKIKKAH